MNSYFHNIILVQYMCTVTKYLLFIFPLGKNEFKFVTQLKRENMNYAKPIHVVIFFQILVLNSMSIQFRQKIIEKPSSNDEGLQFLLAIICYLNQIL